MLAFHAPVDGPKAAELRRLLTGPKDAVEKAIKVWGEGGSGRGAISLPFE